MRSRVSADGMSVAGAAYELQASEMSSILGVPSPIDDGDCPEDFELLDDPSWDMELSKAITDCSQIAVPHTPTTPLTPTLKLAAELMPNPQMTCQLQASRATDYEMRSTAVNNL